MHYAKQIINTLGVKKCEANKKQPYLCAQLKALFDIS